MRVFGVILAGGQGRRLGGVDKSALTLDGRPLLDLAIERLKPQVERLCISANGGAVRPPRPWPVLSDLPPLGQMGGGMGPLAGILAAMRWAAKGGADYLASVAVDTPHFPCDLVARLRLALDTCPGATLALARGQRVHATFGLWPVALGDDLALFLASGINPRVRDFAARFAPAYADFADESAFDNINTAADLDRLGGKLGGQG